MSGEHCSPSPPEGPSGCAPSAIRRNASAVRPAAHAARSYLAADFRAGDALVFGKESSGLSPELVAQYTDRTVGIPTLGAVRSLNLANAASVAVYEALRQTGALSAPFQG